MTSNCNGNHSKPHLSLRETENWNSSSKTILQGERGGEGGGGVFVRRMTSVSTVYCSRPAQRGGLPGNKSLRSLDWTDDVRGGH